MEIAETATIALRLLWRDGFFKTWKKLGEIKDRLAEEEHNFSTAELGMALGRARYLTRRGPKGKYEYIQKHPCLESSKSKETAP